jgi:hypothetical protein
MNRRQELQDSEVPECADFDFVESLGVLPLLNNRFLMLSCSPNRSAAPPNPEQAGYP